MDTKTCTKCGETKAVSEFNKHRRMKDGLSSNCKVCTRAADKVWRESNPEKFKEGKARAYQANKEHYNQKTREWVKNNPDRRKEIVNLSYQNTREKRLEYFRKYRKENKEVCAQRIRDWEIRNIDRVRAKGRKRQVTKLKAIPKWLTESQKLEIDNVYNHARDCELISGQKYHVDHIIPLQGKGVCGLHVPWNLQVLPSDLNIAKGNRYDQNPDYYCPRTS